MPIPHTSAGGTNEVVVLGAGLCGLFGAYMLARNGIAVTILEQQAIPGGLASSVWHDGNAYELGVHHLHGRDKGVLDQVSTLLGNQLLGVEKHALLRFGDAFRHYPLQFRDLLFGLKPLTLAGMLAGYLGQQVKNRFKHKEPQDAEEALIYLYGGPLYRMFFRDFTERYWDMPVTELSAGFVWQKMPRLRAVDVLLRLLAPLGFRPDRQTHADTAVARERVYYTRRGMALLVDSLCSEISRLGGRIVCSARPLEVNPSGAAGCTVAYSQGSQTQHLACAACLSTIPLGSLVRLLPGVPDAVRTSAANLRYKAIAVYGLLVKRERLLPAQYVYFRKRLFHRLAEPKQCGLAVEPAGHSLLLCEMTCTPGDKRWRGDETVKEHVLADVEAEGILKRQDVCSVHHRTARYAYPLFLKGYERHLCRIQDYIAPLSNLIATGRQGAFCFANMHRTMRLGWEAADKLAQTIRNHAG